MALGRMSIQDLGVAPGAQKLIRIPGVSWITVRYCYLQDLWGYGGSFQ